MQVRAHHHHGHHAIADTGPAGGGTALAATPEQAAAIARGEHQIWVVDGDRLEHPSQRLPMIESQQPFRPGQTHIAAKHIGDTLEDNVDRLQREPDIRAAGGFYDLAAAQRAVDRTIANPANQRELSAFLADPGSTKEALLRVDLGEAVGANVTREDFAAGRPTMRPATTATVVEIKDPTFPEGYRTLTAYPEATRPPEVDRTGRRIG